MRVKHVRYDDIGEVLHTFNRWHMVKTDGFDTPSLWHAGECEPVRKFKRGDVVRPPGFSLDCLVWGYAPDTGNVRVIWYVGYLREAVFNESELTLVDPETPQ
jgi:hypothetical protein